MTKKRIWVIFSLIILLSCCVFTGCTVSFKRNNTQNEKEYVVWKSESNDDGITLEFTVIKEKACYFGIVGFNGETHDICMSWSDLRFIVLKVDYYGKEYDFIDISGNYAIKGKNTVELEIYKDKIYGGALDGKKIVVNAYDLEDRNVDIAKRHEVCWESENNGLKLYTYQGMRNFSVGNYSDGATKSDVVVYWLPGQLFEVYELRDGVQQSNVVMSGKYVCGEDTVELTYRIGNDDTENKLLLLARSIDMQEYPNELWYPASE